jgi:hypothetical protein
VSLTRSKIFAIKIWNSFPHGHPIKGATVARGREENSLRRHIFPQAALTRQSRRLAGGSTIHLRLANDVTK